MTKKQWKAIKCHQCDGLGVYGYTDPIYCTNCEGSGYVWLSKAGRVATYPGGQLMGSLTKEENDKEWEN